MAGGKNPARKSNDANESSEGGEDIFPGSRKERAGEAAEAEMGQDPLTKSVPRWHKSVPRQHKKKLYVPQINLSARR